MGSCDDCGEERFLYRYEPARGKPRWLCGECRDHTLRRGSASYQRQHQDQNRARAIVANVRRTRQRAAALGEGLREAREQAKARAVAK